MGGGSDKLLEDGVAGGDTSGKFACSYGRGRLS